MNPEKGAPEHDEGTVLSPEELDLADKDGVEEIDEGRYVVSPDGTDPSLPPKLESGDDRPGGTGSVRSAESETGTGGPSTAGGSASGAVDAAPAIDRDAVRGWCERRLSEAGCEYGYHVSAKVGDRVDHHTLHSDDVTTAFNNLLLWYARTIDADMPPGAVLGILLSEASVPVRYPVKNVEELLMTHGLSTDDTIADLLEAVRGEGEVVFPP